MPDASRTRPEDLFDGIADALDRLDEEAAPRRVLEALEHGAEPLEIIDQGIIVGVRRCGEKLAAYEYGVPELLVAGDIAEQCVRLVRPHLHAGQSASKGTIVIATVQGDIHELGKNLVAFMLELSGYRVVDLGVDASPMAILQAAEKEQAQLIALSSLMVTTMPAQQELITLLRDAGKRDRYRVIIGGAPTNQAWADKIGADGWAGDAQDAVRMVECLLQPSGKAAV